MDDLEGRVHGQHRHTDVDDGDAAVGNILCDGAAAAQVEAAQLTDLPCNVVGVHHAGDIAHQLGRSVVCSALAAAAGVLEQRDAAAA